MLACMLALPCRDLDSRLSFREKMAVDEWVESGLRFHVMRDHPSHSMWPMSGGMWGGTRDAMPHMADLLEQAHVREYSSHTFVPVAVGLVRLLRCDWGIGEAPS